jgi:hypothetical protein
VGKRRLGRQPSLDPGQGGTVVDRAAVQASGLAGAREPMPRMLASCTPAQVQSLSASEVALAASAISALREDCQQQRAASDRDLALGGSVSLCVASHISPAVSGFHRGTDRTRPTLT